MCVFLADVKPTGAQLFYLNLTQIQSHVLPHAIVFLPSSDGMEMLLCYEDEGVYVNTYGRIIKDVVLQWGEMPTSVGNGHIQKQTYMDVTWKLKYPLFEL